MVLTVALSAPTNTRLPWKASRKRVGMDAAFDDDPAEAKVHSAEVSPEDVLTGGASGRW